MTRKSVKPSARRVHEDVEQLVCEGGLFDVEPNSLDLNVGRHGKVKDPTLPQYGTMHASRFEVTGVQKNWRGDVVYRVLFEADDTGFGCCMNPDEVELEPAN